jgi:CheY-like chemotaxis protein
MSKTIIAVVDDMFFAAKIRATAEALGVTVLFPRSKQTLFEKLAEAKPGLVLVDLHNQKIDPLDLARELKALAQPTQLLGFFSHVEAELQRNAVAAGYDRVIPRSVFSRDLAEILAPDAL